MNRTVRKVLIAFGATLVALLPTLADSPLAEPTPSAPTPARAVVRVEHEIVAATVIENSAAPRPVIQRGRPLARRHTRPGGFASRARHLIVGSGRHRPEPFPRAGQ